MRGFPKILSLRTGFATDGRGGGDVQCLDQ